MPSLAELWTEESRRCGREVQLQGSASGNSTASVDGEDMYGLRLDSLFAKGVAMFGENNSELQLSQEQITQAENWVKERQNFLVSQIDTSDFENDPVICRTDYAPASDKQYEEYDEDWDDLEEIATQAKEISDIMCSNSEYIVSQESNNVTAEKIENTIADIETVVKSPPATSTQPHTPNTFHIADIFSTNSSTRVRSLRAKRQRVRFADSYASPVQDIEDITTSWSSPLCLSQPSPRIASRLSDTYDGMQCLTLVPSFAPPNRLSLNLSAIHHSKPAHTMPFYSKRHDVPNVPFTVAGQRKIVKHERDIPLFQTFSGHRDDLLHVIVNDVDRLNRLRGVTLTPTLLPPARNMTEPIPQNFHRTASRLQSQFETPTQTHTLHSDDNNIQCAATGASACRLTIMSMELMALSRGEVLPNPKVVTDAICCIVWKYTEVSLSCEIEEQKHACGVLALIMPEHKSEQALASCIRAAGLPHHVDISLHRDERDLALSFVNIVTSRDPDVLVGYEVQGTSWGYLIERGMHMAPPIHLLQILSRVPTERPSNRNEFDKYGEEHESGIWITGRVILNIWRRMKAELKLNSFTQSYLASFLLHRRFPSFSTAQLTCWYKVPNVLCRSVRFLYRSCDLNLLLMEKIDLIRRTAESARLYGIDFFSVLTRGSQYRVEASLLRVAHSKGYIAVSPNKHKVAAQAAMEIIPLVMEPKSDFYVDPVVVLDFQSLYPSMVIAYNLCFTTICGKLRAGDPTPNGLDTTERLGTITYPEELAAYATSFGDRPFLAPNGSLFVRRKTRLGVLPVMLKEILDTRVMVKQALKRHSDDKQGILRRALDARQLALKLLANVTYGYTAAGFSGRMPMAELADAIVQCGRSTLEWTIGVINSHPAWNAEVVYGDTDSVFVHLKGRSLEQAFAIGKDIASHITSQCPPEVVLKFEKVYLPCLLVSKKRYVGQSYETFGEEGHLDAKGIEIVRRDQCPVTVKLQEKSMRILFSTKDLSLVKQYLCRQWAKMHEGGDKLPIKDYIFSKEVRLGHYSTDASGDAKNMPPGAVVATKLMARDPRTRPPYRWRVPYVVVAGSPAARLKDLVVTPLEFMRRGSSMRVNHIYYITKCILPALDRLLSLAGADVKSWYKYMAKPACRLRRPIQYTNAALVNKHKAVQHAITDFMKSRQCIVCGELCAKFACAQCIARVDDLVTVLTGRINAATTADRNLSAICTNCSQHCQPAELNEAGTAIGSDVCQSLDCIVMFERHRLTLRREDLHSVLNEFIEMNNI